MARLFVYSLLSIILLCNVNKCFGTVCQESEDPVCATNGTHWYFFKNVCRLNSENVNRSKDGLKNLKTTDISNCVQECDSVCKTEWAPICATNDEDELETFENRCQFDLENCRYGNIWKVLHEGECLSERQLNHQSNDRTSQLPGHLVDSRCPTHCSLEFDPVCATYNGIDQTFENHCFMASDICGSNRAWVVKHIGECSERCNENCPKIFSPMCATFNGQNKTFNNECLVDLEICTTGNSWDILYNGECRKVIKNCPKICSNNYQPVCATHNGIQKQFPNECFVRIEVCKANEDWKIVHEGPCEPMPTTTTTAVPLCSSNYEPVCAVLNGFRKTFTNKCQMDSENKLSNNAWTVLGVGPCETLRPTNSPHLTVPPSSKPLPMIQPSSQLPIELEPLLPTKGCPRCSDIQKPICAFNDGQQKTFNNECLMLSENCYSNTKWTVGYQGKCHAIDTPRNCPNFCPLNYEPVCGTFNGVSRTFPNECELNYEAYKTNKEWVILNVGECDYCPVCADDIAPVCAEFEGRSRTFDTACKVEAENCRNKKGWKIVSKSACEVNNCPQACPNIYTPVCAISHGEARTFGNVCEMRREGCNTNKVWNLASKGECPQPTENCPQSCNLQYNPVCAISEGVTREFINECFLRSEICKTHKNWEFINAGPCSVPTSSTKIASEQENGPAAQSIGTTSANVTPMPKCGITKCLAFRDPICAIFNGEEKTFSNACFLNNYKCRTGEDWKIIKNGNCRKTSQKNQHKNLE